MKKLIFPLLVIFTSSNSFATNMYFYKDKDGRVLITNANPNDNFKDFDKSVKVKVAQYKEPNYKTVLDDTNYRTNNDSTPHNYNFYETKVGSLGNSNKQSNVKTAYTKNQNIKKMNNIEKYYEPVDYDAIEKKEFKYNKDIKKISYFESSFDSVESDYDYLTSLGKDLLGISSFSDRKLGKSEFISQAHKLGASTIIVYKQNSSEVPYSIYDDPNDLDYIYDYSAYFYVESSFKDNKDTIGVRYSSIPLDKRVGLQRNTGAYVANVIEGTKAYQANVLVGDVVIAINDISIIDANDFNKIKQSELRSKKTLKLSIVRNVNNELKTVVIPINF